MSSMMNPKLLGGETPVANAADAGKGKVTPKAIRYGMSLSSEANMLNCNKQLKHFFERCESIHFNVLIAYWMMAGYLGPVDSVEDSYRKGYAILLDLIYQQKRIQDTTEMTRFLPLDLDYADCVTSTDSEPVPCKHEGLCCTENVGFIDLLELGKLGSVACTDGALKTIQMVYQFFFLTEQRKDSMLVIDGNHHPRQVFYPPNPEKLTYLAYFNPRPDYLNRLIENATHLSVLLLRDCELLPKIYFPRENFKTLTVLEISGSSHLTSIPAEAISQLTQLLCLNLSHLLIEELPADFFSSLLELRWVILRGCSKLGSLPTITPLLKLEVLDLSHSTALHEMDGGLFQHPNLQMLDLSYTAMPGIPALIDTPNLTQLFLGDSKATELSNLSNLTTLMVLDLSGAQNLKQVTQLCGNKNLISLDLSRTGIISLSFLSDFIHLCHLKLQDCTALEDLPKMENLTNLEVLDISRCGALRKLPTDLSNLRKLKELNLSGCSCVGNLEKGFFDQMSCLLKLDLSETKVNHLPSFAKLSTLQKLSLRGLLLDSLEPLTSLSELHQLDLEGVSVGSLEEFKLDLFECPQNLQILNLSHTAVAELPDMSRLVNLKELLLRNCQQLTTLPSFKTLTNLETLDLSLPNDSSINSGRLESEAAAQIAQSLTALRRLRNLAVANRISLLDLSPLTSLSHLEYLDGRRVDELELIIVPLSTAKDLLDDEGDSNCDTRYLDEITSEPDAGNLSKRKSAFELFEEEYENIKAFISDIQKNALANVTNKHDPLMVEVQRLRGSLAYIVRHIEQIRNADRYGRSWKLLYELVKVANHLSPVDFPLNSTNLNQLLKIILKLKLLIPPPTWRATEDRCFAPPRKKNEEAVSTYTVNDTQAMLDLLDNSYKSLNTIQKDCLLCFSVFPHGETDTEVYGSLKVKKSVLIRWWIGEGFIDPDLNMEKTSTMEIGQQILQVLEEKGFIKVVKGTGQKSASCHMQHFVHSFVIDRAKQVGFFDFDQQSGRLTPCFTRSQRACLLKFQRNFSSSYKLWADYTHSPKELRSFKTVRTLFNVNESVIDCSFDWFSRMKNLSVLHLGSSSFGNADYVVVEDRNFLKCLKNMKQLRLLNLQKVSHLAKLPDSICKLIHLRILDLRGCAYLVDLPAGIGSLRNLAQLDITDCHHLSGLPKGIRLLSKLEVLKGFVVTFKQNRNMWTILENKNRNMCRFKDLLNLRSVSRLSLYVSGPGFPNCEDMQVFSNMKNLLKLKITWISTYQDYSFGINRVQGVSNSYLQSNLTKLVLIGFPHGLLDFPIKSEKLEDLRIIGGPVNSFLDDTFSVKKLYFTYLHDLRMSWNELQRKFPHLTYLEKVGCPLTLCPCDGEGIWRK